MGTTVIIAGGRRLVREGFRGLLEATGHLEVVAACGDRLSLDRAVRELAPDVLVLHADLDGPDGGITTAVELRATWPDLGIVLLVEDGEQLDLQRTLRMGSEGRALLVLDRLRDGAEFRRVVREVARGGSFVHPEILDAALRAPEALDPFTALTPRERQVAEQMAAGLSNRGIAAALGLSPRAVEKHINQLFSKLELPTSERCHRRVTMALLWHHHQRAAGADGVVDTAALEPPPATAAHLTAVR